MVWVRSELSILMVAYTVDGRAGPRRRGGCGRVVRLIACRVVVAVMHLRRRYTMRWSQFFYGAV